MTKGSCFTQVVCLVGDIICVVHITILYDTIFVCLHGKRLHFVNIFHRHLADHKARNGFFWDLLVAHQISRDDVRSTKTFSLAVLKTGQTQVYRRCSVQYVHTVCMYNTEVSNRGMLSGQDMTSCARPHGGPRGHNPRIFCTISWGHGSLGVPIPFLKMTKNPVF